MHARISIACSVYTEYERLTWLRWIPTIIAKNEWTNHIQSHTHIYRNINIIHHFSKRMKESGTRAFAEWFYFILFLCVLYSCAVYLTFAHRSTMLSPRWFIMLLRLKDQLKRTSKWFPVKWILFCIIPSNRLNSCTWRKSVIYYYTICI